MVEQFLSFGWRAKTRIGSLLLLSLLFLLPHSAQAFCGFFVAKADASLYNSASQVVLVRDGDRTVISMLNNYKGDLKEFALVTPVPVLLEEGQINVGDKALFDRIDSYSAPRLVEYYDDNPCQQVVYEMAPRMMAKDSQSIASMKGAKALGVTVEAEYTVGEYDIVILSAQESDGLEKWLNQNGYKIPKGASRVLAPYIKQKMKFFVAKVNLEEQAKTGLTYLRPLQFAFETEKFMLPIRLGMINADGPQDLLVYVLTKNGRVETTNYRTVKIPSDRDIPLFVKDEFADFYRALFTEQTKKENMKVVFTEYFWDMGWCDPCAADPLSPEELRKLGVFWLNQSKNNPGTIRPRRIIAPPRGPVPVLITRLHLRYSEKTFPEDLFFQETKDRNNFQARFILRHPWDGDPNECKEAKEYFNQLGKRKEREAQELAHLTGWDIGEIRKKVKIKSKPKKWWETIWN